MPVTIVNNGSILAGGGGGAAGGGGGVGGNLQQQQQTTGQQGPLIDYPNFVNYYWYLASQGSSGPYVAAQFRWAPVGAPQYGYYPLSPFGTTQYTVGQYTYHRGAYVGANQFDNFNRYYQVRRTFPQQQQTQVGSPSDRDWETPT